MGSTNKDWSPFLLNAKAGLYFSHSSKTTGLANQDRLLMSLAKYKYSLMYRG